MNKASTISLDLAKNVFQGTPPGCDINGSAGRKDAPRLGP
jgi:hypothetical protein